MACACVFCMCDKISDYLSLNGEKDSSLTRQYPDTAFGDSSPTDLKTVPRHFCSKSNDL